MEIIKDFILPILTFGLGVVITILWDKSKKKKEERMTAVSRIFELTNDWFNQLYTLNTEQKFNFSNFEKEAFFYSQNRLVLPEYLKIITYLKGQKRYSKLVEKAEDFLTLVTNYERNDKERLRGIMKLTTDCVAFEEFVDEQKNGEQQVESPLQQLDSLLQEMAIESGNILNS